MVAWIRNNLFSKLWIDGKVSFSGIADLLLFSFFVLPTSFGVRLVFFDLTSFRFFVIIIMYMILKSERKRGEFWEVIKYCKNLYFVGAYIFVVGYTNLLHGEINQTIYWSINGALLFLLISYLIQYHYGMELFIKRIRAYAWILCVLSPLELVLGFSPFTLLDTLNKNIGSTTRFGSIRILGNCTTNNGYGLYLLILLSIVCIDYKRREMNIKKNMLLILMIAVNVFLTGARLATGLVVLELALLTLCVNKNKLGKTILIELGILSTGILILFAFRNVGAFEGVIRTILTAVDTVLGTSYSVAYGADSGTLYNSTYYRELLYKNTIFSDWLNPWFGRGANYSFRMYIEGYYIYSCDNFYVAQYIGYAWPGLITWFVMSLAFFKDALMMRKNIALALATGIFVYFIGLWYLDHLQTFPFMFAVFAIIYSLKRESIREKRG